MQEAYEACKAAIQGQDYLANWLLFRRDLAQLLADASPKDFKIVEMV
ncbi:hypothetical protein [Kribbella sp. C-35]